MVVGLTIVKAPGGVRRINENRPISPPFAMISYNAHYYSRNQIGQKQSLIPESTILQTFPTPPALQVKKRSGIPRSLQIRSPILITAKAQQPVGLMQVKQNCSKVEQILQQKFINTPSIVKVNIGHELDTKTGALVPTTKVNLLNTVGTFGDNERIKNRFVNILGENNLQAQTVLMDREHVTVSPILYSYGIPRESGGTFFMLRSHHKTLTQAIEVDWPLQFGYDPQKGNAIDWHEHLATNYDNNLINIYDANPTSKYLLKDNKKAVETLDFYGIDINDVRAAARSAHTIDINTLFDLEIPPDLLFPTSHINMVCNKGKQDFDLFTKKSAPGYSMTYSANKASKVLNAGLKKAINVNKFYFSLEPNFVQGTTQRAVIQSAHRQFVSSIKESITFTIERGGSIDQNLLQEFETRLPAGRLYDLDQAENVARTEFDLHNVKRGVKSCLWNTNSPRTFNL